jgi:hypothetical protein
MKTSLPPPNGIEQKMGNLSVILRSLYCRFILNWGHLTCSHFKIISLFGNFPNLFRTNFKYFIVWRCANLSHD